MSNDLAYRLIAFGWLALAVIAPVAVYGTAAALARRHVHAARWWRVGGGLATLLTLCTLTPAAVALGVCAGPPAGESDAARAFKARSAPLLAALERYRADHGGYPTKLDSLVPRYLTPGTLPAAPADSVYPVEYRTDGADYTLEFQYRGPGMNVCTYRPAAARWRCQGYF